MREYATNLTLLTDFYELTMMNGYIESGMDQQIGYFDYFFRKLPDKSGFAISCGLASLVDYIENLKFSDDDIAFLRGKGIFGEKFLSALKQFRFSGDIWAMPEGTPVFPNEPIVIVRGTMFEAQLIETALLLLLNHQSLICSKANRIVRSADGRAVLEFGARRAQGVDAAVLGARAAYIAGCAGSSNTVCDKYFGVPASGTMAHSWIQLFDSEYEAFKAYTTTYPDSTVLLVDTYNVLKSGVPNAIKVFDEVLKPLGKRPVGIRLDSGDIAYLSKKCRVMLDDAGYSDCKIFASNSLDETIIRDLLYQGAKIDAFGVGERLITSKSWPVFGGVYKLAAVEVDGVLTPKIKLSENVEKITVPGFKQVWRLFNKDTNSPIADVITAHDETIDTTKPYELFHPDYTWKRKRIDNYYCRPMLVQIYRQGECVYQLPSLQEVRAYCQKCVAELWEEVSRFENPHRYYVDLSYDMWQLKRQLIERYDDEQ